MGQYYKFDPGNEVNWLGDLPRHDAEELLKGQLRLASRMPDKAPPKAVILFKDGTEIWRWTQRDRMHEEAGVGEPVEDIVSDTRRYKEDAIKQIELVEGGARLAAGMTKDEALRILNENIDHYDSVLKRFGRSV